ncbi:MAG: DsrE family protein [Methanobacterium sp.]|nr:DsrE family protein [Methanobacterium sp.]
MVENTLEEKKILTIILTEGPYRSQYVEIAHNIAESAINMGYIVNLFLYMDATHIPKTNQNPNSFPNVGERLKHLIKKGANVRACVRCATARGHACDNTSYLNGVLITSVYDIPEWVRKSNKVITLSG